MVEIKRLSDADIEKIRNQKSGPNAWGCPSCLLSMFNNGAGVNCEKYVGLDSTTCGHVKEHAIYIEMEARKNDMNEKQLPTESELRKELQDFCDKFNAIVIEKKLQIKLLRASMSKNCFYIVDIDGVRISNRQHFRPDIQPPAKNTIVQSSCGRLWFSMGVFMKSGELRVTAAPNEQGNNGSLEDWITLDRSQHSEGWDPDWEKEWKL